MNSAEVIAYRGVPENRDEIWSDFVDMLRKEGRHTVSIDRHEFAVFTQNWKPKENPEMSNNPEFDRQRAARLAAEAASTAEPDRRDGAFSSVDNRPNYQPPSVEQIGPSRHFRPLTHTQQLIAEQTAPILAEGETETTMIVGRPYETPEADEPFGAYHDEIRRLGIEANALLRDANLIDASLAYMPRDVTNAPARSVLIERKDTLRRQRKGVLLKQKGLVNEMRHLRNTEKLPDSPSIAGGLRAVAGRVGMIERLYHILAENKDNDAFDWQHHLRLAIEALGDTDAYS